MEEGTERGALGRLDKFLEVGFVDSPSGGNWEDSGSAPSGQVASQPCLHLVLSTEEVQRIHTHSQPPSSLRAAQNPTNRAQGSDSFFLLCFFMKGLRWQGKIRLSGF